MTKIQNIPIVLEDMTIQDYSKLYPNIEFVQTNVDNGREEELSKYTLCGKEGDLVEFLVGYCTNIVDGAMNERFNLEEFLMHLAMFEPPLEEESHTLLKEVLK